VANVQKKSFERKAWKNDISAGSLLDPLARLPIDEAQTAQFFQVEQGALDAVAVGLPAKIEGRFFVTYCQRLFLYLFGQLGEQKLLVVATPAQLARLGIPENPGQAGEVSRLFQTIIEIAWRDCAELAHQANHRCAALDAPAGMQVMPLLQGKIVAIHQPEEFGLLRQDDFAFHQAGVRFQQLGCAGALAGERGAIDISIARCLHCIRSVSRYGSFGYIPRLNIV